MNQKPKGSLTRANKIIVDEKKIINPVYSLHNWCDNRSSHEHANPSPHESSEFRTRGRLLLYKAEESVLGFLFRWLLQDDTNQNSPSQSSTRGRNFNSKVHAKGITRAHSFRYLEQGVSPISHKSILTRSHSSVEIGKQKLSAKTLLKGDIGSLPDRHFTTIAKLVFRRWSTPANIVEAFLILILISLCVYQCYELLDDYFRYPTHVSITKLLNENFRSALPAVTVCNNNQMSLSTLDEKHPEYNISHLVAISAGTLYSLDNFTLPNNIDHQLLVAGKFQDLFQATAGGGGKSLSSRLDKLHIDWHKVSLELGKDKPSRMEGYLPNYDLIDTVTCANIWGEQYPCTNIRRVRSYQKGAACTTLFHESTLYDKKDSAVQELEEAIEAKLSIGTSVSDEFEDHESGEQMFELDNEQLEMEQQDSLKDPQKVRIEMGNMEVLRLRINFQGEDYANKRTARGATLSVHAGAQIGLMDHITFRIGPGWWYSYYLERFDFKRLPAPYQSNCYNYEKNRLNWLEREQYVKANKLKILKLLLRQSMNPSELLSEYVDDMRRRSISSNECLRKCNTEMAVAKCNCWHSNTPYTEDNINDANNSTKWCHFDSMFGPQSAIEEIAGDDLYFQSCAKEFFLFCRKVCPDDCLFSSFDVTQQSRSWPSYESRRYITDQKLLSRLKVEGECCATVSVLYAAPSSSLHLTEAKYTRQDMVTIISGNIEAWIGVSAVHAYLFLEQFYDTLLEVGLISQPQTTNNNLMQPPEAEVAAKNDLRVTRFLISILTSFGAGIIQLFTRLFHQIGRFFLLTFCWFKNKH